MAEPFFLLTARSRGSSAGLFGPLRWCPDKRRGLMTSNGIVTKESTSLLSRSILVAFFVFTVAGFAGDVAISPLQQWFIHDVLHETPSVNNRHHPVLCVSVGSKQAREI